MPVLRTFILLLLTACSSFAQLTPNPLVERRIDPQLLDTVVSPLAQDLGFVSSIDLEIKRGTRSQKESGLVIYDPYTHYGIDLFLQLEPSEDRHTLSARDLRRMLDQRMRQQHRMPKSYTLYDSNSIRILKESENGETVIGFAYRPQVLTRELRLFKFIEGRVYTKGDQLDRIELINTRSFFNAGMEIERYKEVFYFRKQPGGGYLISSSTLEVDAYRFGTPYEIRATGEVLNYSNEAGPLAWWRAEAPQLASYELENPDLQTIRVKLDRTLPFYGNAVRKHGFDLPKPVGIQTIFRWQHTDLQFTSFSINGSNSVEALFDPDNSSAEIHSRATTIRGDVFLLPFLNVSAFASKVDSTVDLDVAPTDAFKLLVPGIPDKFELEIPVDTTVAGIGTTVAAGYRQFFFSLSASYAKSVTGDGTNESNQYVILPIAGYQILSTRTRIMAGAEYLALEERMKGSLRISPTETFDYDIGVEGENWAGIFGVQQEFGRHWEAIAMVGLGETRTAATFSLGYRF
ncbi:hypothetical protein [Coraliomargarita akajimensis]|uniref:Uncharacterized protein n=1 Tax=Coraliomargarita akajimensis (strain DSM 45221 / IAM 15411 / JCM 23193 / KCTC 12865 / 04OKA010-24) TaxID=583355 RepID=D5EPC7_CORAD|nr:hypothetical protein [Coraliomargarita akajimensis]ADE55637.1 hypothetical protein Caka_2621 [Coraliomargarita akajimensis DSM 45221]